MRAEVTFHTDAAEESIRIMSTEFPEIVDYCLEKEIPIFPDTVTPSEAAQAVKRGLKVVKFFPAAQLAAFPPLRLWRLRTQQ